MTSVRHCQHCLRSYTGALCPRCDTVDMLAVRLDGLDEDRVKRMADTLDPNGGTIFKDGGTA